MGRGNNRATIAKLKKLTQPEYNAIIEGYIRRVHGLPFFRRARFAFNILIKGQK